MPAGRPCSLTQEVADIICERLSVGESLRSICADEDMPGMATVFRWLARSELSNPEPQYVEFREQYARSREEQADAIFDECLRIADDSSNDYMDKKNSEGEVIGQSLNAEHVQRSRLRIDTRKWMAGKMRPKKYGDKIAVDNTHDISDPMKELLGYVATTGKRVGD